MKSLVLNRSIVVAGRKTSVSLEEEFWKSLRKIAREREESLPQLITDIDAKRGKFANLSSALRMFVLRHYRDELDRRGGAVTSLDLSKSIEHTARR
jgi:predicted DNA-binding ribbon-helix-helix protein